ncbi:MAG TPA: glycerate kinase [Verrucomicrobiae bacterium]
MRKSETASMTNQRGIEMLFSRTGFDTVGFAMPLRVLIVPDKFKGSLTAHQAAGAIARGWHKGRPEDFLDVLPMSDGGDGFGEVLSELLGAAVRWVAAVDAAHRPVRAPWWWKAKTRLAIVESATVNSLARLAGKGLHPFQLDTFGLGKVLRAAERAGAKECVAGIGGSATNDGGFGLARGLGWRFFDGDGAALKEWWQLSRLADIRAPKTFLKMCLTVAVDVRNPLLGLSGCSAIYGPQKGLRREDLELAEKCLARMARVMKEQHGRDCAKAPGAGAAGGLGFGLTAFAGAKIESGFELFARRAGLEERIAAANVVVTGEGTMDEQTRMGKGVGQVARACGPRGVPCIGLAGIVDAPAAESGLFARTRALIELADLAHAQSEAAQFLERLAAETARAWR